MTEELNDNQSQELENNEVKETPVEETSTEAPVEATIEPTADQLVAEWKDKYVRLTADFENFRRQRNLERRPRLMTMTILVLPPPGFRRLHGLRRLLWI